MSAGGLPVRRARAVLFAPDATRRSAAAAILAQLGYLVEAVSTPLDLIARLESRRAQRVFVAPRDEAQGRTLIAFLRGEYPDISTATLAPG
jgi:hypothetical protein